MQQAPSGGEHEAEVLQPTRGVLSGETWEATPDGLQASPSPLALALTLTLARTRTRARTLALALPCTLSRCGFLGVLAREYRGGGVSARYDPDPTPTLPLPLILTQS